MKKEMINKITEEQKTIAFHFGMTDGWNPLGNPNIFKGIQENIFNYFLGNKHTLDKFEVTFIKNKILQMNHDKKFGKHKEQEIADSVDISKKYPEWDKEREFWECKCGMRMIPYPFKRWKEEIVNRMYRLRKREVNDIISKLEDYNNINGLTLEKAILKIKLEVRNHE